MHKPEARTCFAPLPRERLVALAENLGLPGSRDLIPNLVRAMTDRARLLVMLPSLPPDAAGLLRDLVLADACGVALPDKAILAGTSFRTLYDLGFAHVGRDHLGALRAVLARETVDLLALHYRAEAVRGLVPAGEVALERLAAHAETFRRNAGTLIALVETEGIALTAKGEITKNELARKILPVLEPAGYGLDAENRYPVDLGHILRYLLHFEVLKVEGENLSLGPSTDAFLDASEADLAEAAVAYAGLDGEPEWATWLVKALATQPEGAWIEAEPATGILAPESAPRKLLKEVKDRRAGILEKLEVCGAIESGWTASGTWFVRSIRTGGGTPSGARPAEAGDAASRSLFVTADFKIAAPRQLPSPLRRSISRFARLVRSDRMDQWEITRESISRAADSGLDTAAITGVLADNSATPLPGNVTESIRLWQEHHRDVVYHHGPTLIVQTPSEQKWVRELVQKEGALASEPLPGLFILHPEATVSLLEKIRARRSIARVPVPRSTKAHARFADVVEGHRPPPAASQAGGVQIVTL